MQTLLIELRKQNSRIWQPVGVASVSNGITGTDVLDRIRVERPSLADHAIRVRKFIRIPGVFDDCDNPATGRILYIEDMARTAPV